MPDARSGTPLEPDKGVVEGGGCACNVRGRDDAGGAAWSLLLAAAVLLRRRRPR